MLKLDKLIKHLSSPVELISIIKKNLRAFYWQMSLKRSGVAAGDNVILKGKPVIMKFTGTIRIGNNVTLRSDDYGYHASIYAPTRLMTDTNEDATIEIGDNTRINGASIHATKRISIGANCLIAANVTIIDSDGHGVHPSERTLSNPEPLPVIIENNVWIGINSIILKGVRIGENSVIGAGSVVTKSIPADCFAAGNPARVIKFFDDKEGQTDEG